MDSHPRPRFLAFDIDYSEYRPQEPCHGMERDFVGMRLAVGRKDLYANAVRNRDRFGHDAALADTRRADDTCHAAMSTDRPVQHRPQSVPFPFAPDQSQSMRTDPLRYRGQRHQTASGHRFGGALDLHHLRFAEYCHGPEKPCGGLAQHHTARRRHRFHALRHADVSPHRGVAESAGTDLTGDHFTRVQPDSQLQRHRVPTFDFDG